MVRGVDFCFQRPFTCSSLPASGREKGEIITEATLQMPADPFSVLFPSAEVL